ncbi:MAG TPA: alpha/beta fold hydrolase [Pseudonocardiaceae bacterium]|nr:alpha/beta fold hydrolase [Pseudonocardiaceae bacterium]
MTRRADPATVAAHVVALARDDRFEEAAAMFGRRLRKVVTAETFRTAWSGELATIGPVSAIGPPATEPGEADLVRVRVPVTGEHGSLDVIMSVDDAGTLQGLRLAPATPPSWQPPPYADPSRFGEQDITVGTGSLAVPGTLTLPHGPGPWPGVVLLSGGGPFDRDETSGVNKPLKDIAWGLAGRGIAVARFDRMSFIRPEVTAGPGFTMSQEFVPHAIAAVRLLQQQSTVDPERVFVLGHSMGGRVAPRVASAEDSIAGLVILAGDAGPMQRSAARVARYLETVSPGVIPAAALAAIDGQVAFIEGPDLAPTTPAADLPFGWPGSFWLEVRDDDPVGTAAAVGKPMFIAQGGRDYQVTVADDLALWQAGLAGRDDVTFRVYEAGDHLFFPGEGPSTPAGYQPPQHVDPAVIADVAAWLTLRR